MDKCCKNCAYYDDYTWVCFCPDSVHRADFTNDDHVCEEWKEIEKENK